MKSFDFSEYFFLLQFLSEFHFYLFKWVDVLVIILIERFFLILRFGLILLSNGLVTLLIFNVDIELIAFIVYLSFVEDSSDRVLAVFIPISINVKFQQSHFIFLLVFIIGILLFPVCKLNTGYLFAINDLYQPCYCQNDAQTYAAYNCIGKYNRSRLLHFVLLKVQHQ